ncbi:MAG: D-glycerate dehydrogenase [Proteobacteria bacterium]|nr:D-glycerate dehydrogenase [Pseudomonadota bacterium]MBU1585468.1 D-glycerate dehydrogenase [Pseudomonadota bacterium]MBU2628492.1 D-glycerate dehydrogenase [Pseudomonadota bacterium]
MEKKILVTRRYPETGIRLLEQENFHLTFWEKEKPMTQDELIKQAKTHDALLCTLTDKIDSHFFNECSHLDIISQFAVGYDNIDIASATRLGIPIGFTPDAMSEATADIAFGLMIAVARKMFFLHKTIINGQWGYFNPTGNLGIELKHKTLGIFGLGRIGIKMAQRCKNAYEMNILYHNRTPSKTAEKLLDATYVEFEDLLSQSDVLSVHCALTPETKDIFNQRAFKRMKPSALFINTARGPIHHEKDLICAIRVGDIWGAGLDVTNPEPMQPDNPLLFMENVCVLPHVGSGTQEARNQMSVLAAMNIIEFYKKGHLPHIVNPEVLES